MTAPFTTERRVEDKKTCELIDTINERLDNGDSRMNRIEAKLDANSADTAEMLDILLLGKTFFRILGIIGNTVKWIAAIAAPVVIFWYTLKNGKAP